MTPNNNFSVLPFYASIDEQNHLKSYAYGEIAPLYAPTDRLLPFQIITPQTDAVAQINLIDFNTKRVTPIDLPHKRIDFAEQNQSVFVYEANEALGTTIAEGRYYLTFNVGTQTYYSDIMTCVNLTDGFTKIEWYDDENVVFDSGKIVYENVNYKNILYLCTEIGKPTYKFEEEGEERDGYFFAQKQLSEKTYRFTILAPEYQCDVMRLIRMADHIKITDNYGREYNADAFLMTVNWQTQGDLASVECEFETDTIVKKIGKGYINHA